MKLERVLFGVGLKDESLRDEFETVAIYLLEKSHPREAYALALSCGFTGHGKLSRKQIGQMVGRARVSENKHIVKSWNEDKAISAARVDHLIQRAFLFLDIQHSRKILSKYVDHKKLKELIRRRRQQNKLSEIENKLHFVTNVFRGTETIVSAMHRNGWEYDTVDRHKKYDSLFKIISTMRKELVIEISTLKTEAERIQNDHKTN